LSTKYGNNTYFDESECKPVGEADQYTPASQFQVLGKSMYFTLATA